MMSPNKNRHSKKCSESRKVFGMKEAAIFPDFGGILRFEQRTSELSFDNVNCCFRPEK